MFTKGEFINWISTDESGERFAHVGQVVSCNDERVEFITTEGTMSIPLDDGRFTKMNKPSYWNLESPKKSTKSVTAITQPKKKKVITGSKKQKALDIYKELMDNNQHPQRAIVIAEFMDKLDMTKAGASTYQNTCKKYYS